MAVKVLQKRGTRFDWSGLSTDTKPTSGGFGSTFYEEDTTTPYLYGGSGWVVDARGGGTTDIAALIHAATTKTTPVDADELTIWDSVSTALRKVTWSNIKATLKAYFDTIYATLAGLEVRLGSEEVDGALSAANASALPARVTAVEQSLIIGVDLGHDHTAFIDHALATAANDFLVASGSGVFAKQTLLQAKITLGLSTHFKAQAANFNVVATGVYYFGDGGGQPNSDADKVCGIMPVSGNIVEALIVYNIAGTLNTNAAQTITAAFVHNAVTTNLSTTILSTGKKYLETVDLSGSPIAVVKGLQYNVKITMPAAFDVTPTSNVMNIIFKVIPTA